MKVATAEIMRKLDRKAIEEFGIPGLVLMENAARGTVGAMFRHFPGLLKMRVGILAGRGNNGGDGFAVARYLLNRGISCQVYLLAAREEVRGDAAANLEILIRMGGAVSEILNLEEWESQKERIAAHDLLVDGILGTGLKGEVQGFFRTIIEFVNSLGMPVVAIDIPSGLDADNGRVLGVCIRAHLTVTFGLLKRGLLLLPGAEYCGKTVLVDISLPRAAVDGETLPDHLIEGAEFLPFLIPRQAEAHKGDFGHLFVLSGSPGKTGAAAMVCQAALRVGTGLVTLGIPESLNPILEEKLTEAMTEPLPETREKTLAPSAFGKITDLCSRKSALALGPGLSTHPETVKLVQKLVRATPLPTVIDADGLNAVSGRMEGLQKSGRSLILTPHPGEMARMLGVPVKEVQQDRVRTAREFSRKHGVILVLKGARSLVAGPEGDLFINPTGNPAMASGGMGDILTGMIGGFLAQGLPSLEAAKLGVYLHGLVGDYVAHLKGDRGILAMDLAEETPKVLRALGSEAGRVGDFSFPLRTEISY
ncbi:MAG: NAD(P)H-hydrate dehydratase [Syntrophaceae bacterium]|nr:NAD(P)H-hydrate dehydratase [Syntrophaceae bacterium]